MAKLKRSFFTSYGLCLAAASTLALAACGGSSSSSSPPPVNNSSSSSSSVSSSSSSEVSSSSSEVSSSSSAGPIAVKTDVQLYTQASFPIGVAVSAANEPFSIFNNKIGRASCRERV